MQCAGRFQVELACVIHKLVSSLFVRNRFRYGYLLNPFKIPAA